VNINFQDNPETAENKLRFRWSFVILPLVITILSVVLSLVFLSIMPSEVVYHFDNGLPDRWTGAGNIVAWTILPQVVLFLFAIGICAGMLSIARRIQNTETRPVHTLISTMGNMIALPQIIHIFAMLDIFLYNSYQIRLIPLWLFALIAVVAGSSLIGLLFARTIKQLRKQQG
jgi:uncharacterized membrane protein